MIYFFRSIFAQTLLNAYFIYRIKKSDVISSRLKWVLYFVYAFEILLFFTGLFAGERLSVEFYTLIQKISGIWVLGHVYLCFVVIIFFLLNIIERKWHIFRRLKENTVRKLKLYCFLFFLLFIGINLYMGYENYLHPKVENFSFEFNKRAASVDSPKATYRLVVISDLHLGYIIGEERLKQYVGLINAQKPDVLVVVGDLIDYTLKPLIAGKMHEELLKLEAPKGKFLVLGNHEYKFDPELRFDWISKAGFTILKDSVALINNDSINNGLVGNDSINNDSINNSSINNVLYLIGRDDRANKNRLPIEELMSKVDLKKPCIFLAHRPSEIKDAYRYEIPLTICGHTHGGQAFPVNLLGRFLYASVYGMQQKGASYSYTTSGLGLSGVPLRIASDSELVVFDIKIY